MDIFLNIIGILGTLLVIVNYFLQQRGIMRDDRPGYYIVVIIGSAMVMASLYANWNFSSFILQVSWIIISLAGLFRIKAKG